MTSLKDLSDSGVDVEKGLFYCSDDIELYLEMLKIFGREKRNVPGQINIEFKKGEIEAVRFLAHGLKGVSGTIGGKDIFNAADALEFACIEERSMEEIDYLITDLAGKINPVLEVLENIEEINELLHNNTV